MSGIAPVLVLYASTSGSTVMVVDLIRQALARPSEIIDLKDLKDDDVASLHISWEMVIAGTPTYGIGDWHHLWQKHFRGLAPVFQRSRRVMLFALGDARGHSSSFAGGLGVLYRHVAACGVDPTGWTTSEGYRFKHSPALIGDAFPGLVVEYRRDRHAARGLVQRWLSRVGAAERLEPIAPAAGQPDANTATKSV